MLMALLHGLLLMRNCSSSRAWSNVRWTSSLVIVSQSGRSGTSLFRLPPSSWNEPSRTVNNVRRIERMGLYSQRDAASSSSSSAAVASASTDGDAARQQIRRRFEEATELWGRNLRSTEDPDGLRVRIAELEREQSGAGFWDGSNAARAAEVNSLLGRSAQLRDRLQRWERWQGDGQVALEMLEVADEMPAEEREMLLGELRENADRLLEDSRRFELELLLSGPYDGAPARIRITAGAGGTEANDWVADLKRMYERHAARQGYAVQVEDETPGDVAGYKGVELLVSPTADQPRGAYGWFQGEKGAHRLVRLSPFNANNKRQTTFAGVDVTPDIASDADLSDIDVPDADLEITTMRASGKGGQNVNKVNSAVRIKHLPTGLQVKCAQERSQHQNRKLALLRLKAALLVIAREQRVQEIRQIRGDIVEASWGAQIRNYVLHPYKIVKDQRTGWETTNTEAFLDGDLEDCIGAYLQWKAENARLEQQQQEEEEG